MQGVVVGLSGLCITESFAGEEAPPHHHTVKLRGRGRPRHTILINSGFGAGGEFHFAVGEVDEILNLLATVLLADLLSFFLHE